ncbi:radial spoke head protein 9 homolog [Gastrophryne carolinensis]
MEAALEQVSGSGLGLSREEGAALRTSLVLLQRNLRLRGPPIFWGKILGLRADYFLCRSPAQEEGDGERLHGQRTFYSLNAMDWLLLAPASEAAMTEAGLIRGRFIGDPSHEYEVTARRMGDSTHEEPVTTHIKEETRLAAVIHMMDQEAVAVPRGAFIRDPTGRVTANRSFRGLTVSEANQLRSFLHFTPSRGPRSRSLLEKADLDPALDFLESLEHDVPKGCWSLRLEQGGAVVALRSLLWPGMTCYHTPNTAQHGWLYVGTGERNTDLPFMI